MPTRYPRLARLGPRWCRRLGICRLRRWRRTGCRLGRRAPRRDHLLEAVAMDVQFQPACVKRVKGRVRQNPGIEGFISRVGRVAPFLLSETVVVARELLFRCKLFEILQVAAKRKMAI